MKIRCWHYNAQKVGELIWNDCIAHSDQCYNLHKIYFCSHVFTETVNYLCMRNAYTVYNMLYTLKGTMIVNIIGGTKNWFSSSFSFS